MRIDPGTQRKLIDLAAVDTVLNQVRHQRAHVPTLATIASAQNALRESSSKLMELQTAQKDLGRQMARLESDIEAVRNRQKRNSDRMNSGSVGAKDMSSMEHENVTLARRQGELEDQELELMERAESIDSDLSGVATTRGEFEQEVASATIERDSDFVRLDQKLAEAQQQRQQQSQDIPEQLLALYERIAAHGGAGAAEMTQRRCGGCRLDFAGSELATLRAADPEEVVRCDSCGCIQIRTEKSGL